MPRFGRNNFQEAMKLASRVEASRIDWTKFKFMVYDIPNMNASYSERYNKLGIKIISIIQKSNVTFYRLDSGRQRMEICRVGS